MLCVILGATVVAHVQTPPQQVPVFRSGVDLVAVDVQVIGRDGRPVASLTTDDFKVFIDNRPRPVVRATVLEYGARATGEKGPRPGAASAEIGGEPAASPARRYYLLAVDETSFDLKNVPIAMQAARKFIDGLHPRDLVALYSYPAGGAQTNLTTDHALVRRAIDRVTGVRDMGFGVFHMTPAEFIDIAAGDGEARNRVVARECGATVTRCSDQVLAEARAAVAYYEGIAARSLSSLRGVLRDFERIDGRKTIVMLTGGMMQSDRGSRPDNTTDLKLIGEWAAAANTSFYVIQMDSSFLDAFSALRKGPPNPHTLFRDRNMLSIGLERVVDSAGGELIRVEAGTGDAAFARVLRETEVYYLLGVTPEIRDRDGRTHQLRVEVAKDGLSVRNRKQVLIPKR
jgi:VWFA-related protein